MWKSRRTLSKTPEQMWPIVNAWDGVAILLVLALLVAGGYAAATLGSKFELGSPVSGTLNPWFLPYYVVRTMVRLFIALFFSLLVTLTIGTWAAKSKRASRFLLPLIDVLQSVPVLGFLTISVVSFISFFPGSTLGAECAAIFAIFTAQVWNMLLSFYQSLRSVPAELKEAAIMLRLSAWQRFWKVEVPLAWPALLWNIMLSLSGSWVFIVASEAISVAKHKIALPGVGSYIALAVAQANKSAIGYAILAMFLVIIAYDQLLLRPLVAWSDKFKLDSATDELSESWLLNFFQRTVMLRAIAQWVAKASEYVTLGLRFPKRDSRQDNKTWGRLRHPLMGKGWDVLLGLACVLALYVLMRFIYASVTLSEIGHVFFLGAVTGLRVLVLLVVSSLIWVPLGVWIGLHPSVSRIAQPTIQILAAFPVNLLYPLMGFLILQFHLNVNVWVSPLMILGMQWYLAFNVIAGTSALPKSLHHAVQVFHVRGWLWWKNFILPGIFPYYVTGLMTAAGGAWNMSIIAELVQWGNTHLIATGLGAYVSTVSSEGDFPRLALGIGVMSLYVVIMNRLVWRPLYHLAETKFQMKG